MTAGAQGAAVDDRDRFIVVLEDSAAPGSVAMPGPRHSTEQARVDFVQRDHRVSIAAQTTPTGINRVDADLSPTADIDGTDERVNVDVAVIDTASTSITRT